MYFMKYFLSFLFSVIFFHEASSQFSRLIVQLKDKGGNSFSLSNPSQFLSAKALLRRSKYNIPLDSTDLPATQNYVNSIKAISNVAVLSVSKWLNRVLIQTTDPAAISTIQAFPFVVSVSNSAPKFIGQHPPKTKFDEHVQPLQPDAGKTSQVTSNTYNYGTNYNQVHIHEGEFLHNKGFNGSNMQITVLDAGFNNYKAVTAFDSIRMNGQVLGERDYVDYDGSVSEDDTHGMYCLSTMAANWPGQMVGTAPKANFWLVRTENAPNEYPVEEHNWVVGAEFADSTGSDMISSSLGYTTFDNSIFDHTYNDFYKNTATSSQGAALAAKKGMIVMNSAGNEGNNSWHYLGFPADADSVCAVGAVNGQGIIAGFSSRGYPGKIKPNIVSVGVSTIIAGQNNQPASGNGTSFSNPNVAGLIACLWEAFPALSNMQILNAVYRSANRYTTPDSSYGFGIPNFRVAYRIIRHDQNVTLYGNDWLWASPNPFDTAINVKLIGRVDGNAVLYLKNATGQILATQNFVTEQEEVYDRIFQNLGSLPAGNYTVEYTDSLNTRDTVLRKGGIVPLNLISFTGIVSNNETQLKWVSENELDVKQFELQRSEDGVHFTKVYVANPLYGASQNQYAYTDKSPLVDGFYRLKTQDFDNSSSYSNVVELKLSGNQLTIKYNTSISIANIKATAFSTGDVLHISVFAMDGKTVFQKEKALIAGSNEINVSIASLLAGIYIVTAETATAKKSLKIKR